MRFFIPVIFFQEAGAPLRMLKEFSKLGWFLQIQIFVCKISLTKEKVKVKFATQFL